MRPVERGPVAQVAGVDKVYRTYQNARGDLVERLDECCSYCGMHLDASLAVEHVRPKDPNPALERTWTNFLLACTNCNSHKGDEDVVLADHLWPDTDNTDYAYEYGPDALVGVNPTLGPVDAARAQATLTLVGLDVDPGVSPTVSDRRWINRQEKWRLAIRKKAQIDAATVDADALRETVADLAYESGFWSVWMTVFRTDPDMRSRIANCTRGTAVHGGSTPAYDVDFNCLQTLLR